jgi:hypothetical protein
MTLPDGIRKTTSQSITHFHCIVRPEPASAWVGCTLPTECPGFGGSVENPAVAIVHCRRLHVPPSTIFRILGHLTCTRWLHAFHTRTRMLIFGRERSSPMKVKAVSRLPHRSARSVRIGKPNWRATTFKTLVRQDLLWESVSCELLVEKMHWLRGKCGSRDSSSSASTQRGGGTTTCRGRGDKRTSN